MKISYNLIATSALVAHLASAIPAQVGQLMASEKQPLPDEYVPKF